MNLRMALFLDLDGVLADFDAGVVAVTGKLPHQQPVRTMWRELAAAPDFFATLAFKPDGGALWAFCAPFRPTILTGLPLGRWAAPQKRRWVAERLGPDVPVITCLSRDKARTAAPGRVLVDDRLSLKNGWEEAGGAFIHHISAAESIEALKALGFTPPDRFRP